MERPLPPPFDKWLGPIAKIAFAMRSLNHKLTLSQMARLVRPEIEAGRDEGAKKPSLETIKGILKKKILPPCVEMKLFTKSEHVAFQFPWHKHEELLGGVLGPLTPDVVAEKALEISRLLEKRLRLLVGDGVSTRKIVHYGATRKASEFIKNGPSAIQSAPEINDRHYKQLAVDSRLSFEEIVEYLSHWDSLHSSTAYIARVDMALHHFQLLGWCIDSPSIPALWHVPYKFRIGFTQRIYSVPYFGTLKPEMVTSIDELTSPEKIANLQRREQGSYFFDPFLLFAGAFDADKVEQIAGQMNEKHINQLVLV